MSKNTSSSAFRRIDVDQFNEDNFHDEEGPASWGDGFVPCSDKESEVLNLLSNGQLDEALKICLANNVVGNRDQREKDQAATLVIKVMLSIKQNQVESIVKGLDNDQRDLLMKYIYRGFELPSEGSSPHLLFWHEKIFETSGVGSIIRVLTDRKRV